MSGPLVFNIVGDGEGMGICVGVEVATGEDDAVGLVVGFVLGPADGDATVDGAAVGVAVAIGVPVDPGDAAGLGDGAPVPIGRSGVNTVVPLPHADKRKARDATQ